MYIYTKLLLSLVCEFYHILLQKKKERKKIRYQKQTPVLYAESLLSMDCFISQHGKPNRSCKAGTQAFPNKQTN